MVVLAAALLALLAASTAAAVVRQADDGELADFDSRTGAVAPSAAQLEAVRALGAEASWNRFGTPQSLSRHGGYLATGIGGADAASAAQAWLDANKALFRLGSTEALELANVVPLSGSDGYAVVFRQTFSGLAASPDGLATVGVTGSEAAGWKVGYVSSSITGDEALADEGRTITAAEAWTRAARNAGHDVALPRVKPNGTQNGWRRLLVAGLGKPQYVREAAFATPKNGVKRAYEAYVVDTDGAASAYREIVDAATGDVLFRESVVDNAIDNPTWTVFPAYPKMALDRFPWNYPSADSRDLWCWEEMPSCKLAVENQASVIPWDEEGGAPSFTTQGNNARAAESWTHPFLPAPNQFQPTSPTRDYNYPWTNVWFETLCSQSNFVPAVGNDLSAAVTNLFVMHNRVHDWSWNLGFTEAAWNAQNVNFRPGTAANDRILGDVQAGATVGSRDNANMITLPDGISSITNMYLWQPIAGGFYAPCVDGDYDQGVIAHEYGHMIENRLIGKGANRTGFHAGAMGESFSDLNAVEYLNEYNFVPVGGESPYAVGPYVTGNPIRGIRNYNMGFKSAGQFPEDGKYPYINPLNFSDVGYDLTGPQVHADGEIWSATNFDIRELLLDRYTQKGANHQRECADGERPAQDCPGNRRWFQLYYDAMKLMPVGPSFLDARNAILAADVMRFGGANQDLLWRGFARRGFGENAFNASNGDTDPKPDFESPLEDEATVVFNAVALDEGNAPVNARVFVGHYEARVSPIADTNPATSAGPPGANNLDNVARFVEDDRSYEFVASAPGYGHVRFRINDVRPGEVRTVTIGFRTNVASQSKGAVAAGDGVNHNRLIDDTEGTNWQSTSGPVQGRQVTVDLAGGAQRFSRVKVSTHLVPGQNRFTALRSFELYACTAGASAANPTCAGSNQAGFKRILKSKEDAFPSAAPRPVAPELILRTFEVPTTTATHLQLRVVTTQCTGESAFHGEQDNDPANPTDCRQSAVVNQVRATELQAFSGKPEVDGANTAD